jgi:hypothetical protein
VVTLLLLAAAVPWALIHRSYATYLRHGLVTHPRALVSRAYPRLRTGDVLFFIAAAHSFLTSGGARLYYSHISLVLRREGRLFSSETGLRSEVMPAAPGEEPGALAGVEWGGARCAGADGWHRQKNGPDEIPLLTRLKYYPGTVYVMRLDPPLGPAEEAALLAEADLMRAEEGTYPHIPTAALTYVLRGEEHVRGHHCFQHVARLLIAGGAAPAAWGGRVPGVMRACQEISVLAGRPLPGPGRPGGGPRAFRPPVQLLYDLDADDRHEGDGDQDELEG